MVAGNARWQKRLLGVIHSRLRRWRVGSLSFSQSGEDVLIRRLLSRLNIRHPTYLDLGANAPFRLNNTAML